VPVVQAVPGARLRFPGQVGLAKCPSVSQSELYEYRCRGRVFAVTTIFHNKNLIGDRTTTVHQGHSLSREWKIRNLHVPTS
jgi:hypothetical protein